MTDCPRTKWQHIQRLEIVSLIFCLAALSNGNAFGRELDMASVKHLLVGNDYLKRGETVKARLEYRQALKLNPGCYQALNNIGLSYLHERQLHKASEEFQLALKIKPNYADSLNNLGAVDYRLGRLNQALVYYRQALAACRGDAEIQTNIANVYRDQGNYVMAISTYRQAIKGKPDYAPAYNNLGLALHYVKHDNEAAKAVIQAIKLQPNYSDAYYNLALIYRALQRQAQAKEALVKSMAAESNPIYRAETARLIEEISRCQIKSAHLLAGAKLLKKNDWQNAEKELQAAVNENPGSAVAWNDLALAWAAKGQHLQAIPAFHKAIACKRGSFAAAKYNLAQSLVATRHPDQAERYLKQAIEDAGGRHFLARVLLGVIYRQNGDLKQAIENYKLAISQSGDTLPVVHYNLAIAYEKSNSPAKAASEYKTYLNQAPNGCNAKSAWDHLKNLSQ